MNAKKKEPFKSFPSTKNTKTPQGKHNHRRTKKTSTRPMFNPLAGP